MGRKRLNIKKGDRFGRLVVIREVEARIQPSGKISRKIRCECVCGIKKNIRLWHLRSGHTKSCGCFMVASKTSHGMWGTRTYNSWVNMRERCDKKNRGEYKYYGGRGITYDKKWQKFENFLADMGERPVGTSLDRINNDKDYSKSNCRWATRKEQCQNMRSNVKYKGECAIDASRRLGGKDNLISSRITQRGWSKKRAFTTPVI